MCVCWSGHKKSGVREYLLGFQTFGTPGPPTKGVNVTYPRGLEHTSDGGPTKHPEGNPEPPKAKQIAANQHKTRFLENYGEGRDANRQPALFDAALWYAGLGLPVFPLHWVDDQGRCSCNGKPGC